MNHVVLPLDCPRNICVIYLLVRCGSIFESASTSGMSHFLEHLMFRSKPDTFFKKLSEIGATYNAFTMKDMTGYFIVATGDHTPLVLKLIKMLVQLPDRMQKHEFDAERKVILNEIKFRTENNEIFQRIAGSVLEPSNPYNNMVAGSKETIESITFSNLYKFYKKHYSLNRWSWVVCCPKRFVASSNDYLNKISKGVRKELLDINQVTSGFRSKGQVCVLHTPRQDKESVFAYMVFPGFPASEWKSNLMSEFVSYILTGDIISGILVKDIRVKRGLVYNILSSNTAHIHLGMFVINFKSTDLHSTLTVIKLILKNISTPLKDRSQFALYKKSYLNMFNLRMTNPEELTKWHARQTFYGCNADIQIYAKSIDNLNMRDINAHMVRLFQHTIMGIVCKCPPCEETTSCIKDKIQQTVDQYWRQTS